MTVSISRLRRWFGWGAVAVAVVVSAAYFYGRWRYRHSPHEIPGKMGLEIQQTANGFTVSKSEQGRTIFTIRANKAVQYRKGGQAVLRNVAITIYGKQADRFDQIYGSEFVLDQQTGIVTGKGEVQIDLQSNPAGLSQPDQTAPKELKNPVHLKTTGLVFNQKSGDAYTPERVDFTLSQAVGSCVGANYTAKAGLLEMKSKVHVVLTGATPGTLDATHGLIRRETRQVDLDNPGLVHDPETYQSDHGTVYLRADNSVERMVGIGHVVIHVTGDSPLDATADRADLLMAPQESGADHAEVKAEPQGTHLQHVSSGAPAGRKNESGQRDPLSQPAPRNFLRTAILTGHVHAENHGPQHMEGDAGKATFHFVEENVLTTARAEENVRIVQHHVSGNQAIPSAGAPGTAKSSKSPQDVVVNAPVIDFVIGNEGRSLQSAVTSGPPKISILPSDGAVGQKTVITSRTFSAKFDDESRLKSVHGAPDAKIVNSAPNEADRVSTSNVLDVAFLEQGGIESVVQTGEVAYVDADRKAWGNRARYTPNDEMLYLTGSPRFVQGGMTTTARNMRMDRAKGDAYAEGEVKSTYSDLKPQPNGALLASSDPIHVTSVTMVSHRDPGIATYTGNARLWQTESVVQAPIIEFDRDQRSVIAEGTPEYRVSTVFIQTDNQGKKTPVHVISDHLIYSDNDRTATFTGKVIAKSEDATLTADKSDVYLLPQSSGSEASSQVKRGDASDKKQGQLPPTLTAGSDTGPDDKQGPPKGSQKARDQKGGANKIDKIVADGHVVVVQPNRRAVGNHLLYTGSDDRFVLTGGPPSIFDAERGKATGSSLTFYKRDDRVLVEGEANSPAYTETRVAR